MLSRRAQANHPAVYHEACAVINSFELSNFGSEWPSRLPYLLAEGPFIAGEQILDGILPRQFFTDSPASELPHSSSLFGMVEQPEDLVCKIGNSVSVVAI